jgi:hypothetical protein
LRCRDNLKCVIRKASGFDSDNNRGIEISKSPKAEAAYGLVAKGTKLNPNDARSDILAGETFTKNEVDCGWAEILTAARLKKGLSVSQSNLEQIQNFIESFNAGLGAEIKMPVDLNETLSGDTQDSGTLRGTVRNRILEKLENVFRGFSDEDSEDIVVEPLFILALKELLEAKIRRWKNTGK